MRLRNAKLLGEQCERALVEDRPDGGQGLGYSGPLLFT